MMIKLCLASLAILLCAQSATSLQCYECNSNNDKSCMQDIPPEGLKKNCSEHPEGPKYTLCRKIVQHIDFEVNGLPPDHRVIRTCGWEDSTYKDRCYQRAGFGGRQEVCSCQNDYCNSATRAALMPISLIAVAIMTLLRTLLY